MTCRYDVIHGAVSCHSTQETRCPEYTRLIMQTKNYIQQLYRALVIGCMVYAVTLIADTAAAAELTHILNIAQR